MTMELRLEAARRERERLALRRRELDFARDVRRVAASPEGRRLLRRLLEDADLFNPSWTGGEEGAYRAGKKAQAMTLWRTVRRALPADAGLELLLPPPERDGTGEDGRTGGDADARRREAPDTEGDYHD